MTRLDAVRWEPTQGSTPAERAILAAGRYRLRAGRATLLFFSGVTLTMEGPADVDLLTSDRVFCRRGRLRARVPKGAEGFVIGSPGSAVVDLGTEFALNVADNGTAQVMVFEGQAEAALLDNAGSPKRTQMVERSEAFELDPHAGRIAESAMGPDAFVAAIAHETPALVLAPSYPGTVLASRPRGYWRFEALVDGVIPNEVAGSPPLRINGPVTLGRSFGPGPQPVRNGYARFKPGATEQYLDADGLWNLASDPGHAVELWFLAEAFNYATLVALLPAQEQIPSGAYWKWPHNLLLEITARERQSLYRPAAIRYLHRWPLDLQGGDNICSEAVYVPRHWHHVVAQKRGAKMELFFDGAEQSLPLEPDHPGVSCRLVVGRRMTDLDEKKHIRPFVGRLDELALYEHPLSSEEIRQHFQMGSPWTRGR